MSERYDVAIIGTGPAGLSAAITLKIRNKKILLIGKKDLSVKVEKAHEIHNYLGMPAISGVELGEHFKNHLEQMHIEITEERITNVYAMGDYYALQTSDNEMREANAIILATGVNFGKPYPGENEFLGRGVSYCATCDAPLYKGKTVAVIGFSPEEEAEAQFMAEVAETVYYVPMYKDVEFATVAAADLEGSAPESATGHDNIQIIYDKPVSIEGTTKAEKLILKEQELVTDGVFILRESVSPSQLVPGLQVEDNHVSVNRKMETNLPGCFACGDIVGAPYQYIKSAGEGNIAALSAVNYLGKK